MKKQSGLAALALIGLVEGLLTGCGGGGSQATTQRYAAYILTSPLYSSKTTGVAIVNGVCVGNYVTTEGTNSVSWMGVATQPTGHNVIAINATDGVNFVGWAKLRDNPARLASFETGGLFKSSLNPAGYFSSEARGMAGTQQVGSGQLTEQAQPHALLWFGTAESVIDLNPSAFTGSVAYSTDGATQVGSATNAANQTHAALWSGSAATLVDLNPTIAVASVAFAISGGQIVGSVDTHAFLWNGSAGSTVDLHPSGFNSSVAKGMNSIAGKQVGYGFNTSSGPGASIKHALVWSGTASSSVDLEQFLPAGYSGSTAAGIDSFGNIIGSANFAGTSTAILWVPISNQSQ